MSFFSLKLIPIMVFIFFLTLFTVSLNSSTFLPGYGATLNNLYVSILFFVVWFLFSAIYGYKVDIFYKNFLFVYWGINVVVNLFSIFAPFNKLLLFGIWFGGPVYGFEYLVSDLILLKIITPIFGLFITILGYVCGKVLKDKNK
jgi:hypothetical protein